MSVTTRFITPVLLIVVGIAVACGRKVPLGANSDDAGLGGRSDGSVDAAFTGPGFIDASSERPPEEYEVRDCGLQPSAVSQGQSGIVLSCMVRNVGEREILSFGYRFTINGQPTSLLGFSFSPDPGNIPSLGQAQEAHARFEVSVDSSTEAGKYVITILVEAWAAPQGGSTPELLRYDPAELPTVQLLVQRAAVLAISGTTGPAAVPSGEVGRYCVVVRNQGEAQALNLIVGGNISYLDRPEVPPGVTLEPDPSAPHPTVIAGGESAEFCFLLAVASSGAPTQSIQIEWSAAGRDGNAPSMLIPQATAKTIVSVGQ